MSNNPYAAPNMGASYSPPTPPANASRGPAIGLISVSALWLTLIGIMIIFNTVLLVVGIPEEMVTPPDQLGISKEAQVGMRLGFAFFLLTLHSVVLYGGICMLRQRNLGLAYTAAIISVIPCCSGCYIIGIPFGIWALVTLNKPEVSSSFR